MRLPPRALLVPLLAIACKEARPGSLFGDVPLSLDAGTAAFDSGADVAVDLGRPDARDAVADNGFTVDRNFRLVAPRSGARSASLRPTFRWLPQTGATSYRVEFSASRAFASIESSATSATPSYAPPADLPRGLRWWRVVALASTVELQTSTAWPVTLGRAAHDVNGDGRADVVIGAPGVERSPGGPTGEVYLHLGGANVAAAPDVTLSASNPGERFGVSVSTAGDLNGDGYVDVLVGAGYYRSGAAGETGESGRAAVFLGGGAVRTTESLSVPAPVSGGGFGRAVAIVGDYNGDGYDDWVVGAPAHSGLTGRAWLYLGGATLDAMPDVEFNFAMPGDGFAASVAGAGDLNGDGLADVVVGASQVVGSSVGEVRVFLGSAIPNGSVDQNFLGAGPNDVFGSAVAGAGDVDDDGYADLVVGAPSIGGRGRIAVFAGSPRSFMRPLLDVRGAEVMLGDERLGERLGTAVEGAGDVNGDGFDDLVVGAPGNAAHGRDSGAAYLFLGAAAPSDVAAVTYPTTDESGPVSLGDRAVGAGDVDGDGFDDLLLRAARAPSNVGRSGGPGVVYLHRGGTAPSAAAWWVSIGAGTSQVNEYGYGLALRRAPGRRFL